MLPPPLAKDGALPTVCLYLLGFPDGEVANFLKRKTKTMNCCVGGGGKGDGRTVWGVCVCVLVAVCNFP